MSLRKAVEIITENMQKQAEAFLALSEAEQEEGALALATAAVSWATQLKIALLAAPPEQTAQVDPLAFHRNMIEEAKAEFRGKHREQQGQALLGEEQESVSVELVGAPGDGSITQYAPVHPNMPPGAMTRVGASTYMMGKDGRLHFVPPGTPMEKQG